MQTNENGFISSRYETKQFSLVSGGGEKAMIHEASMREVGAGGRPLLRLGYQKRRPVTAEAAAAAALNVSLSRSVIVCR